jgi:hypothetical protein
MQPSLLTRKISYSSTPAGLHSKKVERFVQTIKRRRDATLAALTYILPSSLEAESFLSTIRLCNSLPTVNTDLITPYQAFTQTKPIIPSHSFGTIGIFYHPRDDDNAMRGELGIFLSHGYHMRYIKAYLPHRLKVYSMRKMIPLKYQFTPQSWQYTQNHRSGILNQDISHPVSEDTQKILSNPTVSDPNVPFPTIDIIDAPTQDKNPPAYEIQDQNVPTHKFEAKSIRNGGEIMHEVTQKTRNFPEYNQEGAQPIDHRFNQEGDHHTLSSPIDIINANPVQQSRSVTEPHGQLTLAQNDPKTLPIPSPSKKSNINLPMIPSITTRSGRLVKPAQRLSIAAMPIEYQIYATSLKRLMQMEDRKAQVKSSIMEEIDNLMAPGIMEATSRTKIEQQHIKGIIKLWMFHKEKYDSKGKFIKDKCRIVTLSQHRDTSMIGQTYSPTVNPISFFVTLAITAKQPKYILS